MKENQTDEMEGVENDNPRLMTEEEGLLLDLYDRLEELQLEIALLRAQGVLSHDEPAEVSEDDIKVAQEELLKAKALYQVRTNIINNILVANPILNAVHAGSNATIVEQDLLPLVEKRDALSLTLAGLSSQVQSTRRELDKVENEHMIIAQQNVELSMRMFALAKEANTHRKEDIDDPKVRQQLDESEASMKMSRQRWKIMKETASATIAGSGIDWARDPKLLEIVLHDDGNDEE